MASEKLLIIVSTCLRLNVLLLRKNALNYYLLHLHLRHPQCSLLLLAHLIIDNDDLFPQLWLLLGSLVLFQETRYEMLPTKPFPSLAHAVMTPFWKTMCAIYFSVRLPLRKVSLVSKKPMTRIFSFGQRNRWFPEERWSLTRRYRFPFKRYRRSHSSIRFPVDQFEYEYLHEYPASFQNHCRQCPQLHVLLSWRPRFKLYLRLLTMKFKLCSKSLFCKKASPLP